MTLRKETTGPVHIEIKVAPDVLAAIQHAAELRGTDVGEFISAAARDAAQKAIAGVETLRLPHEAQEQFAALLLTPPDHTPALARAFARHRSMIVK